MNLLPIQRRRFGELAIAANVDESSLVLLGQAGHVVNPDGSVDAIVRVRVPASVINSTAQAAIDAEASL